MKVLITGGAGYIGYTLCRMLDNIDEVSQIVVYDNLLKSNYNFFGGRKKIGKLKFIKGDILDPITLNQELHDVHTVFHLAAKVSFPFNHEQNLQFEQINKWGTANLYRCLRDSNVHKVIYVSSSAIYGFKQIPDENTEPVPENNYGQSKLDGEKYVSILENMDKQVYIARSANVFGYNPCLRMDSVINKFIFNAQVYKKINIYGDGKQNRPFISLGTVCRNLIDFMLGHYKPGTYNLVEFNLNMNEICDVIRKLDPDTEYIRVNQHLCFESLEMYSGKLENHGVPEALIEKAFHKFERNSIF